jgi:O-antigen/teichoic acid export membrane protein
MSRPEEQGVFFSRESVRAASWMLGAKVFLFFVYAAISILVVRMLGPREYGVFALCKNFVEVLVILCSLGLNTSLLRFVPELVLHRNKAGLLRLLRKTLLLQLLAVTGAFLVLVPCTPVFDRLFRVDFGLLVAVSVVLTGACIVKNYYNDVLTSLFQTKKLVIFSVLQSALWLGALLWLARGPARPVEVLAAEILSIALIAVVALWVVFRAIRSLPWRSPPLGIGRQRVQNLALGALGGGIGRALLSKYSETFFLGLYFTPTVVATYDLAVSSTLLVITFVPMALQTVFSSGLAEAYVRDPASLPRLIESLYKTLILLAVPLAGFGIFFAPDAVVVFYGREMAAAGPVAAVFCAVHLLPLLAVPLSMAVGVTEKVREFLPLLYIRVAVNLLLDWLLIPRFGIAGAIAALLLTFVLTFPFRLNLIRSALGGFHFPGRFLLRFAVFCPVLAALVWFATPRESLAGLLLGAAVYFALLLVAFRFLRLVRPADLADLRALDFRKLNRLLDLLTGRPK